MKTQVMLFRPRKCCKFPFVAPGLPVVSFCLEMLGGCFTDEEKIWKFSIRVTFWRLCCRKKIRPMLAKKIFHYFIPLVPGKEIRNLSRSRRHVLWRIWECIYLVVFCFLLCSAQLYVLVQKYILEGKKPTPAPLSFPYVHSEYLGCLCAHVPPWIYSLGWKWRNVSKYFSLTKSNKTAVCCQMLASVPGRENVF